MHIPSRKNRRDVGRPRAGDLIDEPARMRRTPGETLIHAEEKFHARAHEAAQHRVRQSRQVLPAENAGGIDREVHRELRRIARVFDLVGTGNQECMDLRRELLRSLEQRINGRCEAQIPAQSAQRNGSHGRPIGRLLKHCKRFIGGLSSVCNRGDSARRFRKRHRTRRGACARAMTFTLRHANRYPSRRPGRAWLRANSAAVIGFLPGR